MLPKAMLEMPRSIEAAVALLSHQGAADDAAALLHNADIGESEEFKEALWQTGAVEQLVALLDTPDEQVAENAAGAPSPLFALWEMLTESNAPPATSVFATCSRQVPWTR